MFFAFAQNVALARVLVFCAALLVAEAFLVQMAPMAFACAQKTCPPFQQARLVATEKALRANLWLSGICGDRPDLAAYAISAAGSRKIKRLDVKGRGQILAVLCRSGAYNQSYFFISLDEDKNAALNASVAGQVGKETVEALKGSSLQARAYPVLLFPYLSGTNVQAGYTAVIYMRDYDPKLKKLYSLAKKMGDGSGGTYAEYIFHAGDFFPYGELLIDKPDADYQDGYSFVRGKIPKGEGWKTFPAFKGTKGCLVPIADLKAESGCP